MAAHPNPPGLDRGSQAAIITSLLAADPEMQALARQYVVAGLKEMISQLTRGDAQTRAAIARSMSGAVTNLFTQTAGDDGLVELRTEMQQMMTEMRGDLEIGADELEDEVVARAADRVAARVMVPKS